LGKGHKHKIGTKEKGAKDCEMTKKKLGKKAMRGKKNAPVFFGKKGRHRTGGQGAFSPEPKQTTSVGGGALVK